MRDVMIRRYLPALLLFGLLLLHIAGPLTAQGAPDQINIALSRLSGQVNRNVQLSDLDNWRWAQDLYPDMSLGCPQPDTAYAQVVTQAYKFLLTYEGVTYDYRVSANGSVVILCGVIGGSDQAGATPTAVSADDIDLTVGCPSPEPGVIYLPQRMTTDIQARVAAGPPIIQRSEPSDTGMALGEIPALAIVRTTAGPVCADGQLWWQVDYDGRIGWTVEGRDGSYWLEPVPALPIPANLPLISAANAVGLSEISRIEGNLTGRLAAAPNGRTLAATGGLGTTGVWLFDLTALDTLPNLLRGPVPMTDLAYSPDGSLILLGDARGGIRIWSVDPQAPVLERWFDQAHETVTRVVAFSSDGQTVASTGDTAMTAAVVNKETAILLWDIEAVRQVAALGGHTAPVQALAFSPDGALLASASADNTVRLWNPTDAAAAPAVLEGHAAPVQALAFSPDGALLASAAQDGSVIIWDVAARAVAQTVQASGAAIQALAFSPDGALLAGAGGDTISSDFAIRLWDAANSAELGRLTGHTAAVSDLTFVNNGALLVSASADKTLRFWGISAG
jgi:hypothetical protein